MTAAVIYHRAHRRL